MSDLTNADRRILALLRDNARASISEIAHDANLSRTTVKTRLDRLVSEGHITRFTIETGTDDDESFSAVTMIELQGRMSREVIRRLNAIAEVESIYSTSGAWDLIVELRTRSLSDFDRVLREIREVPGVLNSQTSLRLARADRGSA